MKMQIAHVSFSSSGGAGLVASLLQRGDVLGGHDSQLICKTSTNIKDDLAKNFLVGAKSFLDNTVIRSHSFDHMFSISRAHHGSVTSKDLAKFDLIFAHWIPGLLPLENLRLLSAQQKVVLVLHDTFFFTGGCHYSDPCQQYVDGCRSCPNVIKLAPVKKLLMKASQAKRQIAEQSFAILAPSNWVMKKFLSSFVGRGLEEKTAVVRNPIREEFFDRGSGNGRQLKFVAVAGDLENPTKNIRLLIETFLLRGNSEERLVLVGAHQNSLGFGDHPQLFFAGKLGAAELREVFSAAWFAVSFATEEVYGLSVAEAAAVGTPGIAIRGSGPAEIVLSKAGGIVLDTWRDFVTLSLPKPGALAYKKMVDAAAKDSELAQPEVASRIWLETLRGMKL